MESKGVESESEAEAEAEAEAETAPEVAAPMETEEEKEKKKPKPKTHKKALTLTSEGLPGMSAEKLSALIAEESVMAKADQRAMDTDKAMNDFEAYVLATRSKLGDSWFNYVDEASRYVSNNAAAAAVAVPLAVLAASSRPCFVAAGSQPPVA